MLVLATLVMAIGAALQAAVGLGLALFVVPLLALIDVRLIPGPVLLASVALAVMMAYRGRAAINRRELTDSGWSLHGDRCRRVGPKLGRARIPDEAVRPSDPGGSAGQPDRYWCSGQPRCSAGGRRCRRRHGHDGRNSWPADRIGISERRARASAGDGLLLLPGVGIGYATAPLVGHFVDRRRLRIAILTISGASAIALALR